MSQSRKRATFSLLIWGPITVVFLFLFFAMGGPESFSEEKVRFVGSAILFGIGYVALFIMLTLTRERKRNTHLVSDERDESLARQANGAALLTIAIYIFALSITLFVAFKEAGVVPVSWMWFLAYTSAFLCSISHATALLIADSEIIHHVSKV